MLVSLRFKTTTTTEFLNCGFDKAGIHKFTTSFQKMTARIEKDEFLGLFQKAIYDFFNELSKLT